MVPRAIEDGGRLELAEAFLREVVFRSRARQATSSVLAPHQPADSKGKCGLGEHATVALDLSERATELFARLWPAVPGVEELERIRGEMSAWVVEQDAHDRKRNHFLKSFRNSHGFDRTKYTPAETIEFERELERINAREDELRRASAIRLLEPARG